MVNEEKNAARERAIQIKTRGVKNAYKLARTKRLYSRLSDIEVFRTLVKFTSA
jgi:hypothetical protein